MRATAFHADDGIEPSSIPLVDLEDDISCLGDQIETSGAASIGGLFHICFQINPHKLTHNLDSLLTPPKKKKKTNKGKNQKIIGKIISSSPISPGSASSQSEQGSQGKHLRSIRHTFRKPEFYPGHKPSRFANALGIFFFVFFFSYFPK